MLRPGVRAAAFSDATARRFGSMPGGGKWIGLAQAMAPGSDRGSRRQAVETRKLPRRLGGSISLIAVSKSYAGNHFTNVGGHKGVWSRQGNGNRQPGIQ